MSATRCALVCIKPFTRLKMKSKYIFINELPGVQKVDWFLNALPGLINCFSLHLLSLTAYYDGSKNLR